MKKSKSLYAHNGKEYKVLCYYRQPTADSFTPFLSDVEKELLERNAHTMIIGDVNLDANGDNKNSSDYLNLLKSYDMRITNSAMTRNASGRIIEHMTINYDEFELVSNFTIKNNLSDHNAVISQILNLQTARSIKIIEKKVTNWDDCRKIFDKLSLEADIINDMDPETIASKLTDITQKAINKSSSILRFRIANEDKICAWYNLKILKSMKIKDRLAKRHRRNKKCKLTKKRLKCATSRLN